MPQCASSPEPNRVAQLWGKAKGCALTRGIFSAGYALKAPYFRTVLPRVQELEPGSDCTVRVPKWWGVDNHIGTFHAIAALNGAEPRSRRATAGSPAACGRITPRNPPAG